MAQLEALPPDSIDRESDVPYYLQLRAILEAFIDSQQLKAGSPLPSEAELSRTYRLSRTAIRNALTQLELAGRIRRARGRRPVVARRTPWDFQLEYRTEYRQYVAPYQIREVMSNRFTKPGAEAMQALGLKPTDQVLEVVATYDAKPSATAPSAVVRLCMVTDASQTVEELARAGALPDFKLGGPSLLLQLMERYGVDLAYSQTTVTPSTCNAWEARALGVKRGSVVLHVESVSHDRLGRPVIMILATPSTESARLTFVVRY